MKIGPYEIQGSLGRGATGTVFRARAPSGEEVAVKLLAKLDARSHARFERERRLLGTFTAREGFVPLLDSGTTPDGPYLVMPIVPGGTLRERLEKGALGIEETLALGRSLAAALARAHERGVIHRDLKPENVLFTAEGQPLVADLGLGKHFDLAAPGASQSVALSRSGEVRGTVGYMPTEQIEDARSVGPEADAFALGAILYECLAGGPAFSGGTVLELIAKVTSGKKEPLARARPDAPRWLVAVVERALATAAGDRFADGAALLEALSKKSVRPSDRRFAVLSVGLLLVGLALATYFLSRPKTDAERARARREAAESGHVPAMVELGCALATGQGEPKDLTEAARWFRKAAEAGDAGAMARLGSMLESGHGMPKDEAEAIRWYRGAAAAGDTRAMTNLGALLAEGRGVPKDEAAAFEWYRKAAALGNPIALFNLGYCYEKGQGVTANETEALRTYREGAATGDADCMTNLGRMLEEGRGGEKNETEAVSWFRKSATAGNARAMYRLGVMLGEGRGTLQDESASAYWIRVAAEGGIPSAMLELGRMLAQGRGMAKDDAAAASWFRKASDAGNTFAMTNLGAMLETGRGVTKNETEAGEWYRKAAIVGEPMAMTNLGLMLEQGRGMAKDDVEAVSWFRRAAAARNPVAMYNLGFMLERGSDTDKEEALGWYRKAAELGHESARAALQRLQRN